jgi:hypothetical protein
MTETAAPVTPVVETTSNNEQVSKPSVSSKPYDDDMLETYASEHASEESSKTESSKVIPTEAEALKVDEAVKQEEPTKEEDAEATAKAGPNDKIIDGIEEVPLKKLINGKEVEFKIKDAVQAYVKQEEFNRNMDRRITHISQREKRWEQGQAEFKEKVSKVIESAQSGDFTSGIRALAKMAVGNSDADATEFERRYFEQLEKVRDVYGKMSPEQRDAYFAKRALEDARARAKELETEKELSTQKATIQQQVETLQKQYSIDSKEFWENYKILESSQVGEGKPFSSVADITPEHVAQFSLDVRHEEKVLEAGKRAGVEDEAILEEVSRITAGQADLSVDDVVSILEKSGVAKVATPKQVENLNRKAEKSNARFTQANSTKKANGKIEGYDPEDLDFIYRKQPKVFNRPAR